MALNWAMISESGRPVPLGNEQFISTEAQVDLILRIPETPPLGLATTGGSWGKAKELTGLGTVYLSSERFLFVGSQESLQSLSIPLHFILSNKFEQPFFGSNYLHMTVNPTPDGGLVNGTTVEIRFRDRGMFSWVELLGRTRQGAIERKRTQRDVEPLPLYEGRASRDLDVSARDVAEAPPDYYS